MIRSIAHHLLRSRGVQKARLLAPHLKEGDRVLDLGASEGFVGGTLHQQGFDVVLADVADRNTTTLPFVVYDGLVLPFDDDEFDAVAIVYVLHHARDADQLLREALRVAPRVVIIETVYETRADRWLTTFLDHRVNALRGMEPEPLDFDTPDGWIRRISAAGGEVEGWRWLGRTIHHHVLMTVRRGD